MKLIQAMMIDCDRAKQFAGQVVAAMIRLGCDGPAMRRHEIPTSVYYGVLGGRKHDSDRTPGDVAAEEVTMYRTSCLHNDQVEFQEGSGAE